MMARLQTPSMRVSLSSLLLLMKRAVIDCLLSVSTAEVEHPMRCTPALSGPLRPHLTSDLAVRDPAASPARCPLRDPSGDLACEWSSSLGVQPLRIALNRPGCDQGARAQRQHQRSFDDRGNSIGANASSAMERRVRNIKSAYCRRSGTPGCLSRENSRRLRSFSGRVRFRFLGEVF